MSPSANFAPPHRGARAMPAAPGDGGRVDATLHLASGNRGWRRRRASGRLCPPARRRAPPPPVAQPPNRGAPLASTRTSRSPPPRPLATLARRQTLHHRRRDGRVAPVLALRRALRGVRRVPAASSPAMIRFSDDHHHPPGGADADAEAPRSAAETEDDATSRVRAPPNVGTPVHLPGSGYEPPPPTPTDDAIAAWWADGHRDTRACRRAFDAWRRSTLDARADELRLRASLADVLFTADARRFRSPEASAMRLWHSLRASDRHANRHSLSPDPTALTPRRRASAAAAAAPVLDVAAAAEARNWMRAHAFAAFAGWRAVSTRATPPRALRRFVSARLERRRRVSSLFVVASRRVGSPRASRLLANDPSPRTPRVGPRDADVAHARRARALRRRRRRARVASMAPVPTVPVVSRVARRGSPRRSRVRASRRRAMVRDVRGRGDASLASFRGPSRARSRVGRVRDPMARASSRGDRDAGLARFLGDDGGGEGRGEGRRRATTIPKPRPVISRVASPRRRHRRGGGSRASGVGEMEPRAPVTAFGDARRAVLARAGARMSRTPAAARESTAAWRPSADERDARPAMESMARCAAAWRARTAWRVATAREPAREESAEDRRRPRRGGADESRVDGGRGARRTRPGVARRFARRRRSRDGSYFARGSNDGRSARRRAEPRGTSRTRARRRCATRAPDGGRRTGGATSPRGASSIVCRRRAR